MKKKIILIILAIVSLIIITIGIVIGTRYIQYKNIIGEYELVEGEGLKTLNLNLYKWSFGKKEDLDCNLWNCSGYERGTKYIKEDNIIIFRYDKHKKIEYYYSIKKENNNTFIILNNDNEKLKYKKIK